LTAWACDETVAVCEEAVKSELLQQFIADLPA